MSNLPSKIFPLLLRPALDGHLRLLKCLRSPHPLLAKKLLDPCHYQHHSPHWIILKSFSSEQAAQSRKPSANLSTRLPKSLTVCSKKKKVRRADGVMTGIVMMEKGQRGDGGREGRGIESRNRDNSERPSRRPDRLRRVGAGQKRQTRLQDGLPNWVCHRILNRHPGRECRFWPSAI